MDIMIGPLPLPLWVMFCLLILGLIAKGKVEGR